MIRWRVALAAVVQRLPDPPQVAARSSRNQSGSFHTVHGEHRRALTDRTRCHICTGTGLAPTISAPGTGLTRCHICTGTGLAAATSTPGLDSARPHLHWDWTRLCHIRTDRVWARERTVQGKVVQPGADPAAVGPWQGAGPACNLESHASSVGLNRCLSADHSTRRHPPRSLGNCTSSTCHGPHARYRRRQAL